MKSEKAPAKKSKSKAKDFTNEEDVKESQLATQTSSNFIKIREGEQAPIYFMDSKFEDGFEHWVNLGDQITRIPCAGGTEGGGYAADECPLCKIAQDHFNSAKKYASAGKKSAASTEKRLGSAIKGKYAIYFIAAKGERNVVKLQGKKKKYKTEFDNAQIGFLALTKAQRDNLHACRSKYEYITSNKDLFNRYIVFDKQKRNEDEWATIEFIPATKPTPKPDLEVPDELDLDSLFAVDASEIKKLAKAYLAGATEEDDDSGVEAEDDEDVEDDSIDELDSDDDEEEAEEESDDDEEDEEDAPAPKPRGKQKPKPAPVKGKGKPKDVDEDDDDSEDADDEDVEDGGEDAEASDDDADEDEDFLGPVTDTMDDDFEDDEVDDKPAKKSSKPAPKAKTVVGKKGPPAKDIVSPKRGRPAKPAPAPARKGRK